MRGHLSVDKNRKQQQPQPQVVVGKLNGVETNKENKQVELSCDNYLESFERWVGHA